jgi:hypothetical protein
MLIKQLKIFVSTFLSGILQNTTSMLQGENSEHAGTIKMHEEEHVDPMYPDRF